jgi:hypothetical protein
MIEQYFKPNVIFGGTHQLDGTPIIREPRVLKVGIGIPRGKALRAYIDPNPKDPEKAWVVAVGSHNGAKFEETLFWLPDQKTAEACWKANYSKAVDCAYPRKLKYFTFSKPVITDKGGEAYETDFDAIAAHGPVPTRISIMFFNPDALNQNMQMWSATQMLCRGDGMNAMRSVSIGNQQDPEFNKAKAGGEKFFKIIGGCGRHNECQYAQPDKKGVTACKPMTGLSFQLQDKLRIGSSVYFSSTGWETMKDMFSSFTPVSSALKSVGKDIGFLTGDLVIRPYITKEPNTGKATTQYAVHIEWGPEAAERLAEAIRERNTKHLRVSGARTLQIAAPADITDVEEDIDEEDASPVGAAATHAEFGGYEEGEGAQSFTSSQAEKESSRTQDKLAGELKKAREKKEEPIKEQPIKEQPAVEKEKAAEAPEASSAPPPEFPWKHRDGMMSMFRSAMAALPAGSFESIRSRHGIVMGAARHDDQKVLAMYLEMDKATKPLAESSEEDPF